MRCRVCEPQVVATECPACDKPALITEIGDRYLHTDGSTSEGCQKLIGKALSIVASRERDMDRLRMAVVQEAPVGVCATHVGQPPGARAALLKLVAGDRVTHDQFGPGVVAEVKGAGATAEAKVNFEEGGLRRLLLRYAPVHLVAPPSFDDLLKEIKK